MADVALNPLARMRPRVTVRIPESGPIAFVAAAFTAAQMLFVRPGYGLGWDETVYASQVSRFIPASIFTAPRSRGISFLVAPIAAITPSTVALRIYLAVLSGLGLFLALWIWRAVRPVSQLALAGTLFGGLWIAQFYGPEAMPNMWVALAGLAAVGSFLRLGRDPKDRVAAVVLGVSIAVATLMRISDAGWIAVPLALAALVVPRWRHWRTIAIVIGSLAVGSAQWIVEAYVRWGGIGPRLQASSANEGGIAWHVAVGDQLKVVNGPIICRPCTLAPHAGLLSIWWFALPVLMIGGIAVAAAGRRVGASLMPAICGVAVAFPYLFLITYAAPRFLLPAYALLAIPVADLLRWLVVGVPGRLRYVTVPLVVVGVLGQLAGQHLVLDHQLIANDAGRDDYAQIASQLHKLGVRAPCLISGPDAVPLAYYTGCASVTTSARDPSARTEDAIVDAAANDVVAFVEPSRLRPPDFAGQWNLRVPFTGMQKLHGYSVYLATGRAQASPATH